MTYPITTSPNTPLHIEIPVKLAEVKAVFSVAAVSFEGDLPASLVHLQIITGDIADWGATSEVVVVFHSKARHLTLNDATCNADRPRTAISDDLRQRRFSDEAIDRSTTASARRSPGRPDATSPRREFEDATLVGRVFRFDHDAHSLILSPVPSAPGGDRSGEVLNAGGEPSDVRFGGG